MFTIELEFHWLTNNEIIVLNNFNFSSITIFVYSLTNNEYNTAQAATYNAASINL